METICGSYINRGNPGRGGQGSCGGTRKKDGSGNGTGNRTTKSKKVKSKKK